jgi:FMN phosphatase YigB (HAD superfamily)
VLFDMGGVLVELGPLDQLLGLELPPDQFWPRWLASEAVRRYERGACSTDQLALGLIEDFGLALSADEVTDRFGRFPRGLYPGAAELVRSLDPGLVTGVLSNTNPLHWDHQTDGEILRNLFDHAFLSYRLGLVKPDAAIYERVVADLDLHPAEILFLDDNGINVDGARSVGIDGHQVQGVEAARRLLAARGLLRPG